MNTARNMPPESPETSPALSHDEALRVLRNDLNQQGYYAPPTLLMGLQLGAHLVLIGLGLAGIAALPLVWAPLALLVLVGGTLGVATTVHTASHQAFFKSSKLNSALAYWAYTVLLGMGSRYWYHRHIRVHHTNPNTDSVDLDVEQAPFFILSERQLAEASPMARRWQKLQWYVWPLLVAGNGPSVKTDGLLWTMRAWFNDKKRRKKYAADLVGFVMHYALWFGLPSLFFPFWQVLLFNVAYTVAIGYAIFITFVPAHWPAEAETFAPGLKMDFSERQIRTAVNFRTGAIGHFFISGLHFQVEHHLFPGMAHVYYPRVAEQVQAFCEERGLPYRVFGWSEALWKAVRVLKKPKPVVGA